MEVSMCFLVFLLSCLTCNIPVHAQDQSGFISLACGAPAGKTYKDTKTNIIYISDSNFTETGEPRSMYEDEKSSWLQQYWHVRAFPDGIRNCYHLNLSKGDKYFIRPFFLFGDYFGLDYESSRSFDLHLGPNLWGTVFKEGNSSSTSTWQEMVHVLKSDHLHLCLVKTTTATPFISALELRPAKNTAYRVQSGSLVRFRRDNIGLTSGNDIRFSNDPIDRLWQPRSEYSWSQINTSSTVNTGNGYQVPQIVMRTASIPQDPKLPMNILSLTQTDQYIEFDIYMHVAEIQELKSNDIREFEVVCNERRLYGPFSPLYLNTTTIYINTASVEPSKNRTYDVSLRKTPRSTLPPLLNALEVYLVKPLPLAETDEKEVNAMVDIKRTYGLRKITWQGDPCAPVNYTWEGLNCSHSGSDPPRITSLNLASSGLKGKIADSISNLTQLEFLDLSNNDLTGRIPRFLAQMAALRVINLTGNKLDKSIPPGLLQKAKNGSLSLCIDGSEAFCSAALSDKGKRKKCGVLISVIATITSASVITALLVAFLIIKRRNFKTAKRSSSANESAIVMSNRRFTYQEVLMMTNNFQRALGRGGFGVVYHGILEGSQVAVKMLSLTSTQAYKQFKAEVELLMGVHHRNLTSLVGYCNENKQLALIYEFMANGDLKEHLSGKRGSNILSWKARLRVATEAAQGLEYLHTGCRQPIVHRDVKTTNILLDENFKAKLSDFGLSRPFTTENETHVSTVVAGTPGYLDPEYHRTTRLTEKSDVYSFGITLLEIITNRPVIDESRGEPLISEWVEVTLGRADISSIIDPNLCGDFDAPLVQRVLEIAMGCANMSAARRPTITDVVTQLKECLAIENAKNNDNRGTNGGNSKSIKVSVNVVSDISLEAR